jgi:hypothetical protein
LPDPVNLLAGAVGDRDGTNVGRHVLNCGSNLFNFRTRLGLNKFYGCID